MDISSGQLNRILTEEKDIFHKEKNEILSIGLKVSDYINVDDTGARHNRKNGYCTHIGNKLFAWFESTDSKSRINFKVWSLSVMMQDSLMSSPMPFVGFMQKGALISSLPRVQIWVFYKELKHYRVSPDEREKNSCKIDSTYQMLNLPKAHL